MRPFKPPWKPQVLLPVVVVVVHGEIALRAFDQSISIYFDGYVNTLNQISRWISFFFLLLFF